MCVCAYVCVYMCVCVCLYFGNWWHCHCHRCCCYCCCLGIVSQLIGAFCQRLIKLISFSQACSLIKMHKYLSRVCESLCVCVPCVCWGRVCINLSVIWYTFLLPAVSLTVHFNICLGLVMLNRFNWHLHLKSCQLSLVNNSWQLVSFDISFYVYCRIMMH